ncbi:MAG: phosphoglyceromutase [Bacteroidia bacterium]|nr:phosphoglyceromutase [Bacteroidia bacterium]
MSTGKLLPFFWQTIGRQGQLYGNRAYGNKVDCDNPHWFSYPGYSEMLVGFADRKINSNRREENPHQTILSFIHQKPEFRNKVAVFSTWGTIPYIAQSFTSGMHANAGHDLAAGDSLTAEERFLNTLQTFMPNPNGERYDAFTFFYALEYMKRERPRVVYISFDETDQHGHGARYDQYLLSAHRTDQMIALLWQELATMDFYKDNTTLIITTDHGRGKGGVRSFKKHGRLFFGSGQTWMAVLGPDTPPSGEVKTRARLYQCQLAQTIAAFLGVTYFNTRPVGDVIQTMLYPPESARTLSE